MKTALSITAGLACLLAGCISTQSSITHSVFFRLNHEQGSAEEAAFLAKAGELAAIPGVERFRILKETSPKNGFDFGLLMEFRDQAAYDAYNTHPDHVAFVQDVWLKDVADFQEIDHIPYRP